MGRGRQFRCEWCERERSKYDCMFSPVDKRFDGSSLRECRMGRPLMLAVRQVGMRMLDEGRECDVTMWAVTVGQVNVMMSWSQKWRRDRVGVAVEWVEGGRPKPLHYDTARKIMEMAFTQTHKVVYGDDGPHVTLREEPEDGPGDEPVDDRWLPGGV